MKKKELIEIINTNIKYIDNKYFYKYPRNERRIYDVELNMLLPQNKDLDKWINILRNEIEKGIVLYKEAEEEINKFKKNCTHQVRLESQIGISSYTSCIFCHKTFSEKGIKTECVYDDKNRNKYYISFYGIDKGLDLDDYDCEYEIGYKLPRFTNKDIYEMILKQINSKDDEEEIDLVQELKEICLAINSYNTVNEEKIKEEFNILVIGGTNTLKVGKDAIIKRNSIFSSVKLASSLSNIENVNVDLIDSEDNLEKNKLKEQEIKEYDNFQYIHYTTIKDLEKIIHERKEVPYNLIIDFTDLYNYKFSENGVEQIKYNINLKEVFESSTIIRIDTLYALNEKQILEKIKENLINYNDYYIKSNYWLTSVYEEKYYHLEQNLFKDEILVNYKLNDVYKKIKKLI